jgi:hypothetical protein
VNEKTTSCILPNQLWEVLDLRDGGACLSGLRGHSNTMGNITRAELEKQNETNLVGYLSNDSVDEATRLYAAVLLYKRGSRFLTFQEWMKYKNRVLDYLLEEQSTTPVSPFAPNIAADMAGRLHSRTEAAIQNTNEAHSNLSQYKLETACRLSEHDSGISDIENSLSICVDSIHRRMDNEREQVLKSLADHDQDLVNHQKQIDGSVDNISKLNTRASLRIEQCEATIQNLDNKICAIQITFDSYKKKTDRVLAVGSIVLIISSYLIHHFLR